MSKEVILMADVEGLGKEGEVVKVADGYARNYLVPRNLAAAVTDATRRRIEKKRQEREIQQTREREAALELQKRLEQVSCTIAMKTGAESKLFGAVTVQHILDVLKTQGIELDKHQVELAAPIKELGVFNIPLKLHSDVAATLKVWVVEE
jgi:large subunit ribosomal protein L9